MHGNEGVDTTFLNTLGCLSEFSLHVMFPASRVLTVGA